MSQDPAWLTEALVIAIHEAQVAEHGGPAGLRDAGLLASAVARPRQRWNYAAEPPDLATLAADYGFGLARNHPFVDGNKRTALVVMETFLNLNGRELAADNVACVQEILLLAAGELSDVQLADWLHAHSRPALA